MVWYFGMTWCIGDIEAETALALPRVSILRDGGVDDEAVVCLVGYERLTE